MTLKEIKESPKLKEFKNLHPTGNVIVIIISIIMIWRGVWGLLDIYFFPGSPTLSHLASFAIGALILYLDDFRIDNLKR
jgi:Fuseless